MSAEARDVVAIPDVIDPCGCMAADVAEDLLCDVLDFLSHGMVADNPAARDISERIAAYLEGIDRGGAEASR